MDQTGRRAFAFEVTHAKLPKAFFGQYVHPPSPPPDKSLGVTPTGKKIEYSGVAIFHIVDKKTVNGWVLGNTPSLMRQIGKY